MNDEEKITQAQNKSVAELRIKVVSLQTLLLHCALWIKLRSKKSSYNVWKKGGKKMYWDAEVVGIHA